MSERYSIWSALFFPHTGGVESFTMNLAKELVAQGNAVQVVTLRVDGSPVHEVLDPGIDVWRLPCAPLLGDRFPLTLKNDPYRRLLVQAAAFRPTRVLVNTRFYPHSIEGLRLASSLGVPAVVLDHGSAHLTLGNAVADSVIERYEHRMTERAKRYKPVFCGISQKSVAWLAHFGITAQGVIPNAIDAAGFRAQASARDFRAEHGIPADATVVAYAGRLTPEKGPDVLVDATRLLAGASHGEDAAAAGEAAYGAGERPGSVLHAVLAGDGFMRADLERTAPENVHFVGNLAPSDLAALFLQSNLFCLPTRSEGFCTSLLESSACGLPAVIPDVGGARELVPDESFGVIVPDRSVESIAVGIGALVSLGKDALARMGARCRAHVEAHHGWASTVQALEDQYR